MAKITYRNLLQNLPKGYRNKEISEHFATEYRRITKQDIPWQCFKLAASQFRAVYVKKYKCSIKALMQSGCRFLDYKVSVDLRLAPVEAGSTPPSTPPSGSESGSSTTPSTPSSGSESGSSTTLSTPPSGSESGSSTPPSSGNSYSGSAKKPFAALSRTQKYRRRKVLKQFVAGCDKGEKDFVHNLTTTSDEDSYSLEKLLQIIAVLEYSKTRYEQSVESTWRQQEAVLANATEVPRQ